MKLVELKAIIDSLVQTHTDADVDFSYPYMRGGKKIGKLGNMSSYKVLLRSGSDITKIVRFAIAYPPQNEDDE